MNHPCNKRNKMKDLKWLWVTWTLPLNSLERPKDKWSKKRKKRDAGRRLRELNKNNKMRMVPRSKWEELEREERKELLQLLVEVPLRRVNLMLRT